MNKKLLIVDDDLVLSHELSEMFIEDGHVVEMAGDGVKALELINKNPYDVILLDIKLPGMSGIEILKKLRDNPPKGNIFIVSGSPDAKKQLHAEGLSHLVKNIIAKPFDIQFLLDMVKIAG